jgi:hypothetical protein
MLKIKLRVVMSNGDMDEYTITPKVQVEFERQYKTGIAKAFDADSMKMEYIYWVGWKAAHYAGKSPKPFDSWLDDVTNIEVVTESDRPLDVTA